MFLQVDGFEPLPLAPSMRSVAVDSIRRANINTVLMGLILAEHRVAAVVTNRQYKLNSLDLTVVINLILSTASLRTAESWTPVCLAHLNDQAFAYAYISFIEQSDVALIFLSCQDESDQFHTISQQAETIRQTLRSSGCLDAIHAAMACCPVDVHATSQEEVGKNDKSNVKKSCLAPYPATQAKLLDGIIHAAYFQPGSQQYFSSSVFDRYRSRRRVKMLFRNYSRCRMLLRTAKMPSQICIATDHECFYVWLTAEFHMYLAVPRGISTGIIGQFYQWIKTQEQHCFLGSIPCW
jgi:hypothetical protein